MEEILQRYATVHGGPVDFLFPLQSVPHEELGRLLVSESIEHLLLVFTVFTAAHHVTLVGHREQITRHVCCTFYSSKIDNRTASGFTIRGNEHVNTLRK